MIPEGFSLKHNAVSADVWHSLEQWILQSQEDKDIEWEETEFNQNRPLTQFGFRYNYHKDVVDVNSETPPIPDILQRLLLDPISDTNDILDVKTCDLNFTQCIINDYKDANTIIPWHKDDMVFGDIVLVYTFLDERPLNLRLPRNDSSNVNDVVASGDYQTGVDEKRGHTHYTNEDFIYFTAYPRHCSRYILRGPVRNMWEHSVSKGKGRRVSFTFRTLRSADDDP